MVIEILNTETKEILEIIDKLIPFHKDMGVLIRGNKFIVKSVVYHVDAELMSVGVAPV